MNNIKVGDKVRVKKNEGYFWAGVGVGDIGEVVVVEDNGDIQLVINDLGQAIEADLVDKYLELIPPKIDLSKPQFVKEDVKFKVWNIGRNKNSAKERYLSFITPDGSLWFWSKGLTGEETDYNYKKTAGWDNAELIRELPKLRTRLMTRREIMAKICTMDKDNPFLVGLFESKNIADEANFSKWHHCGRYSFNDNALLYYYRHIHQKTGEWTSEPSQFLTEVKEDKE